VRTATAWSCALTSSSFLGRLDGLASAMGEREGGVLFFYPGDFSWRDIGICLLAWFPIKNGHLLFLLSSLILVPSRVSTVNYVLKLNNPTLFEAREP